MTLLRQDIGGSESEKRVEKVITVSLPYRDIPLSLYMHTHMQTFISKGWNLVYITSR